MKTDHHLLLALFAVASLSSCKRTTEEPEVHDHHHGTVRLAVDLGIGANTYTLDSVLTDAAGHKVKLSSVRFYLSDPHLTNDNDDIIAHFEGVYMLADASSPNNNWELGELEVQHIHEVHFGIGLDSATNHADPTLAEAPLNDPTMHWSWNPAQGYKFVVIEGRVDANADGIVDASDTEVTYHLATDDLLTEDEVHLHHDLVEGETYTGHIRLDLGALIGGIDVLSHPMCMTMGDETFALSTMQAFAATLDE